MFADYVKIRKQLDVYQRGLVEFRPGDQRFEKVAQFPDSSVYPGDYPERSSVPVSAIGASSISTTPTRIP